MSIQKITVSGRANVASWLNANATEYFASYTMDGNTMIARDAQNNVMLEWDGSNVKIYKSATVFDTKTADTASAEQLMLLDSTSDTVPQPKPPNPPHKPKRKKKKGRSRHRRR